MKRQKQLRDFLIKTIQKEIPDSFLNGSLKNSLPNIVNFGFKGVNSYDLVLKLDLLGFAVSSGSACTTLKLKPSSVLLALGLSEKEANSSIRISFGWQTTKKDLIGFLKALKKSVFELRRK